MDDKAVQTKEFYKIARAILPSLKGFESNRGRLVFCSPIGHTLRGLCFDTSDSKQDFYLHWFFQPLCNGADHVTLSYGRRVIFEEGAWAWSADTPDLSEAIVRNTREAVEILRRLKSEREVIDEIKRMNHENPFDFYRCTDTAYLLILAKEYDAAKKSLIQLFSLKAKATRAWEKALFGDAHSIHRMLNENSELALKKIKDWRRYALGKLRLEQWAGHWTEMLR